MIVIESPDILSECISELRRQILGEDGQFVLSDKDICKIDKKMELIVDPWTIDLDSKRIKTKLLQLIKEESDEYFYDQFIETKGRMYQYAENILEKISYPILYNISITTMFGSPTFIPGTAAYIGGKIASR